MERLYEMIPWDPRNACALPYLKWSAEILPIREAGWTRRFYGLIISRSLNLSFLKSYISFPDHMQAVEIRRRDRFFKAQVWIWGTYSI